ncbi:peptidase E [Microbacterium sp. NPDC079995]|uniref:Type 1 glutamine amidotransferase-like domain-containing protein n=1 Tax=unclassified Microbacterium TaxID=2609290 RepID=UPI00344E0CF9
MSTLGTIVATCGGWSPAAWGDVELSPVQRYAIDLAGVAGRRPRVAFVNTASGDQRGDEGRELAAAAAAGVDAVHVRLFGRNQPDLDEVIGGCDVVWVGGGSVTNLLAVWHAHGLDRVLRGAWQRGVVLAGTSAGAICWHVGGPTTSTGGLTVETSGLGLIPGSVGVHYDSQPGRRPALHAAVAGGVLPDGFGLDEGAAVVYRGTEPVEYLSENPAGAVYRVRRSRERATEERLPTRLLV